MSDRGTPEPYDDEGEYDDDDDGVYDDEDISDDELDLDFLANNPAMQRVQAALKRQLSRQKTEVDEEIREKQAQLGDAKRQREDTGVSLYTAQQQLAKLQTTVEGIRDEDDKFQLELEEVNAQTSEARKVLDEREREKHDAEKAARSLLEEYTRFQKALEQLDKLSTDMSSDIKLAQRAASKASKAEQSAEVMKQEQDLYVDTLQERTKALADQRKVLQTQRDAQAELTQEALARVNAAQAEVDSVRVERKEVAGQWTAATQGLTKRNEAYSMMAAAANEQEQAIMTKEVEIETVKKLINGEHRVNEGLELQKARIEADHGAINRVVMATGKKIDRAKQDYSQKVAMLRAEEEELRKAQQAHNIQQSEVTQRRQRYERKHRDATELENEVVSTLYDQKTLDRFGQATVKGIKERQRQLTEMDLQLAQLENETARAALSCEGIESSNTGSKRELENVAAELGDRQSDLRAFEAATRQNELSAERNETKMSLLNRDIGQILDRRTAEGAGRSDVTPQELERDRLSDTIQAIVKANAEKQQMWLARQSELVRINKLSQSQQETTEMVNSKVAVLSQKKYRVSRDIETNELELKTLQRAYASLQRDVVKLDTLISKNKGVQESLSNGNVLMETEFLRKLKDEELVSIQHQADIEATIDEKNSLLQAVLDSERGILLWEKKIQLAEEIRAAIVDPDGEGEASAMKKEIHRMKLRLVQLNRQREVLIQDMELAVERRGDINLRKKVATRSKDPNTRTAVEKQLRDLKSKIKQADKDAKAVEVDVSELKEEEENGQLTIEERQSQVQGMNDEMEDLSREYEVKKSQRDASATEIIYFQQLYKHISTMREKGRVVKKPRETLAKAIGEKSNQLQILGNVVEYLAENNPPVQPALEPIRAAIDSRITGPPDIDKV